MEGATGLDERSEVLGKVDRVAELVLQLVHEQKVKEERGRWLFGGLLLLAFWEKSEKVGLESKSSA